MLCQSCNTPIPKKAVRCPECGKSVAKTHKNIYPIAIAGAVISFVGGLFPVIQNDSATKKFNPAYGFMNYEQQFMNFEQPVPILWYAFMLLLVVSVVLCAFKLEKISIATTVLAAVVYGITAVNIRNLYDKDGMQSGLATVIIIIGTIVGIAGSFLDVNKNAEERKRKSGALDYQYTGNKSIWRRIYIHRGFYIMFLPVFIFLVLFNYLPMAGLRYAFTYYKSGTTPVYAGIRQFVDMFGLSELSKETSRQFVRAFVNTLQLSIIKLLLNTFMAVVISLLLHEMRNIYFKKTVQTIIYLPHFMSWVVVASIFKMLTSASDSGLINQLLLSAGMVDKPIEFLTTPTLWRGVYYAVNIWKDTGWGTILFLATLSGISPDLYEAAQIDGANRFNRMRYITLPALANTIITVFILNLAKVMNLFESVYVMYNDSVLESADVLQTYVYAQTVNPPSDYGYTTAVGLFRSVVACILVLACNKASKKVRGRGIV